MEIELHILHAGLMGQGVAHDTEGNLYFVPGAVPGDRVTARFDISDKRYRDAELVSVIEPSPQRVTPSCEAFEQCGGCDWLHWDYPAQIAAKEKILRHVFERGGLAPTHSLPTSVAKDTFGYRNRIQLHSDGRRWGFYKKKSHDLVEIQQCPVTHPKLNEALSELRSSGTSAKKVELSLRSDGTVAKAVDQPHASAGFAQVNGAQNEVLRELVSRWIEEAQSRSVLELYCGNGNLTSRYSPLVDEVFGVDASSAALAQARKDMSGSAQPVFLEAFVDSRLVRRLPRDFAKRYDTLLLDPPRSGAQGCIKPLIHDGLKNIIYVSCAPVAFAKDVQCLKEDFQFDRVQLIDMFPHTRHIEFVASFSRRLSS